MLFFNSCPPRFPFPPPCSAPSSWLIETSFCQHLPEAICVVVCFVCQGGVKTWTGFISCQAHFTHTAVAQCRGRLLQKALVPPLNRCTIKSCAESFPPLSYFCVLYHLFFVSSGSKQTNKRLPRWLHVNTNEQFQRIWPCSKMAPHSTAGLQAGQTAANRSLVREHGCPVEGAHVSHLGAAKLSA